MTQATYIVKGMTCQHCVTGATMAFSSAFVVSNSLRLRRFHGSVTDSTLVT